MLRSNGSDLRSVSGIQTTNAKELEQNIESITQQWRSKWSYGSDMQDGYDGKDLFKVHVIAGSADDAAGNDNDNRSSLDRLVKKSKGDGKVFLDETKTLHQKYGFSWNKSHGGIVVVRPDSHIGYRVNGAGEEAWKDVEEYFTSILSA